MRKYIGILSLATVIGIACLEFGEKLAVPGVHALVSSANAIVGRPLTPVSVAGVARRTTRRCASVYRC
jgi:hypothetical protein